jgi:hypothetical protein
MAYTYKEKRSFYVATLVAICLDIFLLSWVLMKIWNDTLVSVFSVKRIDYWDAVLLKLGYWALTITLFIPAVGYTAMEHRFNDYANMVSVRIKELQDTFAERFTETRVSPYNM